MDVPEKTVFQRIASWIGGATAVVLALVGLKAAVQQLWPAAPVAGVKALGQDDGPRRTPAELPGDYVIPGSDRRLLTDADLVGLSPLDLSHARNEIYARHGRRFRHADLQAYFNRKSWYSPTADEVSLSPVEQANVALIHRHEPPGA